MNSIPTWLHSFDVECHREGAHWLWVVAVCTSREQFSPVQSLPTLQLLRCIQVTVPAYPSASAVHPGEWNGTDRPTDPTDRFEYKKLFEITYYNIHFGRAASFLISFSITDFKLYHLVLILECSCCSCLYLVKKHKDIKLFRNCVS
jgi:hypothetical protein